MENDQIRDLLQKNQELLENLDKRLGKIERKFKWDTVLGVIKWLVIVVPIVFGIIYISPYVKRYSMYLEPALKMLRLDQIQDQLGIENNVNTSGANNAATVIDNLCNPNKREMLIQQVCK